VRLGAVAGARAETCAPEYTDVVFSDIDIVRSTHIAMDIQHGDRAAIHDIRFENIRVEVDDDNPQPMRQDGKGPDEKYSPDPKAGYVPSLMVIIIRETPIPETKNAARFAT